MSFEALLMMDAWRTDSWQTSNDTIAHSGELNDWYAGMLHAAAQYIYTARMFSLGPGVIKLFHAQLNWA